MSGLRRLIIQHSEMKSIYMSEHVNTRVCVRVRVYVCVCAQLCWTLCNPVDCSLSGSSVCGILQARILEWLAIPSSKGSSQPKDLTLISCVSCIGRRILYH